MEVVGPGEASVRGGAAVTIGAFDGVHLGHRRLLELLRRYAAELDVPAAVVTFDRHPATVIRPESAPLLLTDLDQKLELLASCGIDLTVVVPFDRARADESAEDFVDEVLVGALRTRRVVVGADFHFGHGRKGNVALLEELGRVDGFEVDGVQLSRDGGEPVSSTRIRGLLARGDVAAAASLLGRPHQVRGTVVRGDGRGAGLGFPTANVAVPPGIAVPGTGIYAGGYGRPDGTRYAAAVSVGRRPTFYDDDRRPPLVEAFVLDFGEDLYGEEGRVSFDEKLRDEQRFERVEDLVAQMRHDVDRVRRIR
ncbi:MAG: bifunctional riboflavin kinase/FAD synthetase [Acidimicrobiales bacterium]